MGVKLHCAICKRPKMHSLMSLTDTLLWEKKKKITEQGRFKATGLLMWLQIIFY